MGIGGHVDLRELAERIRAIEHRHDVGVSPCFVDEPAADRIATSWAEIDAELGGGLPADGLHEWFGMEEAASRRWLPPLCILTHLAWQALDHRSLSPWTVWIGKSCHPYPRILIRGDDRRLLERSLFVAPRDVTTRLWAIDLALRSPAVGCVIADGSALDRAATQRIQLLARKQTKAVFAARPTKEISELSAAQTRWRVCIAPAEKGKAAGSVTPRWKVELLRCKGMRPVKVPREWRLEWNRAEGAVHLSARLVDLAGAQTPSRLTGPARRRQQTA